MLFKQNNNIIRVGQGNPSTLQTFVLGCYYTDLSVFISPV